MEHGLQLYQEESCLLDALAEFVAEGLRLEEGVVIIGSMPRWELLLERLRSAGVDAHARMLSGQLRLLGTHLLRASLAHRQRFNELASGALSIARARFERVRVFSELTDALWRDGDRANAHVVERYWRPLLNVHGFKLLCACPIDSLEGQAYDGSLQALCAAHTPVHPAFDEEGFEEAGDARRGAARAADRRRRAASARDGRGRHRHPGALAQRALDAAARRRDCCSRSESGQ